MPRSTTSLSSGRHTESEYDWYTIDNVQKGPIGRQFSRTKLGSLTQHVNSPVEKPTTPNNGTPDFLTLDGYSSSDDSDADMGLIDIIHTCEQLDEQIHGKNAVEFQELTQLSYATRTELHMGAFLMTFVYELMHPFAWIISIPVEGLTATCNRCLLPRDKSSTAVWLFTSIINVTTLFLILSLALEIDMPNVYSAEVGLAIGVSFWRILCVATKHALFSQEFMDAVRTRHMPGEIISRTSLARSWMFPETQLLLREVKSAIAAVKPFPELFIFKCSEEYSADIRERLHHIVTELNAPRILPRLERFIHRRRIHGHVLCILVALETLTDQKKNLPSTRMVLVAHFLCVLMGLVPFFIRHHEGKELFGDSMTERMVMVLVFFHLSFATLPSVYRFMVAALVDFYRRYMAMLKVSEICSHRLDSVSNVYTFQSVRRVTRTLAESTFRKRIELYCSYFVLTALILLTVLVMELILSQISLASVIIVSVTFLMLEVNIGVLVGYGASTNNTSVYHSMLLVRQKISNRLTILHNRAKYTEAEKTRVIDADFALEETIRLIETYDALNPVKIFGLRASMNILRVMFTGTASIIPLLLALHSDSLL
eukprot:GFYU01003904.1.p1 GENE.GFYU01003904.1~~GFYU01003904.1.p1  ORF type:complete len:598 (-),score=64.63 GFYU01003904.1:55-1848(-)